MTSDFINRFSKKYNRPVTSIIPEALNALTRHTWPGNVRELRNTIERAVILCTGEASQPQDIQLTSITGNSQHAPSHAHSADGYRPVSIDIVEREHILATLSWAKWNKAQSARILGIERSTLDRKLKQYAVERPRQIDPNALTI